MQVKFDALGKKNKKQANKQKTATPPPFTIIQSQQVATIDKKLVKSQVKISSTAYDIVVFLYLKRTRENEVK